MPSADTDSAGGLPSSVERAAEVFDEYGDFIRAVIGYHVQDEAQADDICQDFFLTLVSKTVPQDVKYIKGYLYRMIVNCIVDAVRRVEAYRTQMHQYAEGLGNSTDGRKPEDALAEAEQMNKMFEVIGRQLTPTEGQAVSLRYKNNCDIAEIAEKMGVNKRSVSRYIAIGFGKIRRCFKVQSRNSR